MTRAAYLIDGVRSPFGRYGGGLAQVRADDLAAAVIAALLARTNIPAARVDEVILGCANQAGEDNRNVARMALLLAGMPIEVPGVTVNRLCGSGLQAITDGARMIACGEADLVIAGGVEQMTRAPFVVGKNPDAYGRGSQTMYDTTLGWRFVNPKLEALHEAIGMGETAERVALQHGITREAQDAFALASQQKAGAAQASGRLAREIVPITTGTDRKTGTPIVVDADEHLRPDMTAAQLAKLRPAFTKAATGTVTAGNASGLNDGAAAVLLASDVAIKELGLTPKVRFVGGASAGVAPSVMGLGPVPATRKVLAKSGLSVGDIDLIELNEAFAAQALACIEQLGLEPGIVNVNGGAIALGHPLGASGARIVLTLMHELELRSARRGLATMCIGVGQGVSMIIERV